MWRFAPAGADSGQARPNAPRQPCRTMPAYPAPAFLWENCVCVRMLPRCEIEGADSPNSAVGSIFFV